MRHRPAPDAAEWHTLRHPRGRQGVRRFEVDTGDPQELMARLTGNYKHGNERMAKHHARNRHR